MIKIEIHVDTPMVDAQGVKEWLAQELERFGDVRVVRVEDVPPEQMRLGG